MHKLQIYDHQFTSGLCTCTHLMFLQRIPGLHKLPTSNTQTILHKISGSVFTSTHLRTHHVDTWWWIRWWIHVFCTFRTHQYPATYIPNTQLPDKFHAQLCRKQYKCCANIPYIKSQKKQVVAYLVRILFLFFQVDTGGYTGGYVGAYEFFCTFRTHQYPPVSTVLQPSSWELVGMIPKLECNDDDGNSKDGMNSPSLCSTHEYPPEKCTSGKKL